MSEREQGQVIRANRSGQAGQLSIDRDELVDLILRLGNIPSPAGHEGAAGQFVYEWMGDNGMCPRKVGFTGERFNVVGRVRGTGGGKDLLLNAHLDTAYSPEDRLMLRNPLNPFYNTAWLDQDGLYGEGVQNDKGPLACILLAAKAVRESGVTLKGDVLVTAVCGEIGLEPVDEFQGLGYVGKDIGAHWLMTHGGIYADYALVAEGTDFRYAWVEAGKACCKVTLYGSFAYTPFVRRSVGPSENSLTVLRLARFIDGFEAWARDYERRHRYECHGGVVEPKAQIGAVRGGYPFHLTKGPELIQVYIDVRLVPGQDPREVVSSLMTLLRDLNLEGDVDLILFRQGYEAKGIEPLFQALTRAHRGEFGTAPEMALPAISSMWRDTNVFNEFGIPALTYGPPRHCPIAVDDMVRVTRIYAGTILELCG